MDSCEKALHICNKSQYQEASFWEILRLKYHLFICAKCAGHSKKNGRLTELCDQAALKSLSLAEKEELKKKLSGPSGFKPPL